MFRRTCLRLNIVRKHLRSVQMSSSAEEEILFHKKSNLAVVTLNRPKALNALSINMVRKLYSQLLSWETDPQVGLILIKGTGEKSFCSGGDIIAVTEAGKRGDVLAHEFFREEYILNHKIGNYKKPYIALIDGITMGGGVGLSVHGAFRVATERTMFAMPETAIGLFPDVGTGHFLPRLAGNFGLFLALTGHRLRSIDVKHVGIATHFIESSKVDQLENKLAELTSGVNNKDVAAVLTSLESQSNLDANKEFGLKQYIDKINNIFAGETIEKIFDNLEQDKSQWATEQLQTLKRMSPTSLKISLRLLREGKHKTLAEDLITEYRLSQRCIEDTDFYEGVRSVIIDRDNKPKWNPSDIKDVSSSKVDWYFSPLDAKRELVL